MLIKFRAMQREGFKPLNEFGSLLAAIHVLADVCKDNNNDGRYFIERKEFPQED